jgi:hypothetical protein
MSDQKNMIRALAEFLTGAKVARHSIGLQLGGQQQQEAEEFFAVRYACGVSGYIDADEAENVLRAAFDIERD